MTNINKRKRNQPAELLIPMVGTVLLLCSISISQGKSAGGTNVALTKKAESKRDPFWPVGYVPERVKEPEVEKIEIKKPVVSNDWSGAMKKVVINGVSSRANNDFFAVINGGVKSVNDTVSVVHGGVTYTWAIASIKPPGSVKLRRVSAL